jgi:hypothetical protein
MGPRYPRKIRTYLDGQVRFAVLIPFLLSLSACSARQSNAPSGADDAPDAQPDYDVNRISVPFLVDDHFIPSGCMGDCAHSVSIDSDCPMRGSPDAQGECHHFVFTAATGASALGWAGVLWQTTETNWGSLPGRQVAPGATGLHFYAAGEAGGEKLDFLVGGMVPDDAGKACDSADACASGVCDKGACTEPHHDTLDVIEPHVLAKSFGKVDILFGTADYGSEVLSGFGWTAKMPPGQTKIEFYVDDLRWE